MWIGTRMGLYLLDKESGSYQYIDLPVESPYICALYQREDGILYIGTRGAGLLVYDINKKKFIHQYRTDNCALISDNIYTILPRQDGSLLMGTENGITIYSPEEHFFRNWTREQGLRVLILMQALLRPITKVRLFSGEMTVLSNFQQTYRYRSHIIRVCYCVIL